MNFYKKGAGKIYQPSDYSLLIYRRGSYDKMGYILKVTAGWAISPETPHHLNILDSSRRVPLIQHKSTTQYYFSDSLTLPLKLEHICLISPAWNRWTLVDSYIMPL
jgi:hypothetical protein